MTWAFVTATVFLLVSGVLILIRMIMGPTTLNRTVAVDMFVATLVGGIGVYAAFVDSSLALPVLVVLALVGSLGSVSVAKFVGRDDREDMR